MIHNFLLQLIRRLQNIVECNKPSAIEFNNYNYQDLLSVQVSIVYIDGEECAVILYDENGNRYRSDYRTGITIDNLYKICPVIQECLFVCCKWEKGKSFSESMDNLDNFSISQVLECNGPILGQHFIPDGWIHFYAGCGSRYFIKTDMFK